MLIRNVIYARDENLLAGQGYMSFRMRTEIRKIRVPAK